MIVGMGTDIVELARMDAAIKRGGENFLRRFCTERELREAKGGIAFYAGRWAAKEAASKALGCGIGAGCSFTDIEVSNDRHGAPVLQCHAPAALELEKRYPHLNWHLSISHEHAYAVATVIIESVDGGSL